LTKSLWKSSKRKRMGWGLWEGGKSDGLIYLLKKNQTYHREKEGSVPAVGGKIHANLEGREAWAVPEKVLAMPCFGTANSSRGKWVGETGLGPDEKGEIRKKFTFDMLHKGPDEKKKGEERREQVN